MTMIESAQCCHKATAYTTNHDIVRLIGLLTIDEFTHELIIARRGADHRPAGVHDRAVTVRDEHRVIRLVHHKALVRVYPPHKSRFADCEHTL